MTHLGFPITPTVCLIEMLGLLLLLLIPALFTLIWIYKYIEPHSLISIPGIFVFLGLYVPFVVTLLIPIDVTWVGS